MVRANIVDDKGRVVVDLSKFPDYQYSYTNGIHSVLLPELGKDLDSLTSAIEDFRARRNEKILDSSRYARLPYVSENNHIWKNRQRDLEFLLKHYSFENKRVLEIGSWNSWLTHHLANAGAVVTAIGYFTDENDGLGARRHYPNANWTAIQMDCEDLSILEGTYDVVIFNWNLMNFNNPFQSIVNAKSILSESGLLVALGVLVCRKPEKIIKDFQLIEQEFQQTYKRSICLRPFKGYFSIDDFHQLEKNGFLTTPNTGKLGVLKSFFKPSSAVPYRAIYQVGNE